MGNPLGSTLANAFLCYHEKLWLDNCPPEFKPKFYRRYIDDTFLLFDNEGHVNQFLNYLNKQHKNIKFTCELEKDKKLSFLDVEISRNAGKFTTKVYRKPTFTGLGMKFDSFIPNSYKKNIVSCLVNRAYKICSDFESFTNELRTLQLYFTNNRFPLHFVENVIKKTLNDIWTPKLQVPSVPKKPIYLKLPFIGRESYSVKRRLSSLLEKFYPQLNFKLILSPSLEIYSFFKCIDKLTLSLVSSVIY